MDESRQEKKKSSIGISDVPWEFWRDLFINYPKFTSDSELVYDDDPWVFIFVFKEHVV